MTTYYNTAISATVRNTITKKIHRIRKIGDVPYVTYKRKTRVLFQNPVGGAFINVDHNRVYFL